MSHETKMAIVEDILTGIVCSQAWGREQLNNPEIVKNAAQLERVMCTVSEYLPEEMLAALEDAITNCIGAHEQAAILFGIHTAYALREVAAGVVE